MNKRLFICADRNFPRGDAGSNRILFMAKALQEKGWNVIVISTGKRNKQDYNREKKEYVYEGITYHNITFPANKLKRVFEHYFLLGNMFISAMKDIFHCSSEDRILLYTSNLNFSKKIVKYAIKEKIGIACDIVEWHQPFQFEGADKSWLYRKTMYPMYHKFFYKVAPSTKNIIAISNCLREHFVEEGCNTIVVPIYVDIDKRQPCSFSTDEKSLRLIYPGNPYKKDDFESMIGALTLLSENERKRIRFHLTGAPLNAYKASASNKEKEMEEYIKQGVIVYHSWLEYSELMKLYEGVDFALLPRPINITTQANFPSKVPEMMNKGIPIIMNRVGDIADYLTDNVDSILYDGEGAENCVIAIRRVLALSLEERTKIKKRAYENAAIKFDYHLCSNILNEFFENLNK